MHIFERDGVGASISGLPMYAAYGANKAGVILPHRCCQNPVTCLGRSPVVQTASIILSCLLDDCYDTVRTGQGRLRYLPQDLCVCSDCGTLCARRACCVLALKESGWHQTPDSMDSMVPIAGVSG